MTALKPALVLCLLASAAPGWSQSISDCTGFDPDAIVEPWDQNSASYAKGAIRIALLDQLEPAAAPFALLILSPPVDEVGGRSCQILRDSQNAGFAALDFAARQASYDPATGLTLTLPAQSVTAQGLPGPAKALSLTINQTTGQTTAQITAQITADKAKAP